MEKGTESQGGLMGMVRITEHSGGVSQDHLFCFIYNDVPSTAISLISSYNGSLEFYLYFQ